MIGKAISTFLFFTIIYPVLALGWAESASTQEGALQIAKNRLASIEDRKKAIDQLKSNQDPEMIPPLIEIVRNPEEAIAVRGYIVEMLIELEDDWATLELKKISKDSTLSSETQKLALYALWKKDAQAMKPELMSLAKNVGIPADLRMTALTYLSQTGGDWPPEFWVDLYIQKSNPPPVRIAALNGMREFDLLTNEKAAILKVIQDPREPTELRKSTVLMAGRIFPPGEFERGLISILLESENSLEMKRFALDNLVSSNNKALLPQLKRILSQERNPILSNELKTLIATLSSKS